MLAARSHDKRPRSGQGVMGHVSCPAIMSPWNRSAGMALPTHIRKRASKKLVKNCTNELEFIYLPANTFFFKLFPCFYELQGKRVTQNLQNFNEESIRRRHFPFVCSYFTLHTSYFSVHKGKKRKKDFSFLSIQVSEV
jgi:hypothetical protein